MNAAAKMQKIKSQYTAECKNCQWKGSKYKVLISTTANFCPNCESDLVFILDKAKNKK